ncbi:MAG: Maf family protein [Stellaceae bacterium]|jgi:nucleoside triphosphate pyrophosphatase
MIEELILASASPARARLLAAAGIQARVEPAEIDEIAVKQAFRADRRSAVDCALALAEAKAGRIARNRHRALVIGADQILVCAAQWLDKPADLAAARAQLKTLRGRTHALVTAVCVVQQETRLWHIVSRPRLTMRNFSDGFLDEYLAVEGAAILGSVGAYRLEGKGVQLFDRVEGDHFAVLGMPLLELLAFLRNYGAVQT